MAYKKVGWKDYPSTDTPINATNLDHMDAQILENSQTIGNKTKISDIGDGTISGAIEANKEEIVQNAKSLRELNEGLGDINAIKTTDKNHMIQFEYASNDGHGNVTVKVYIDSVQVASFGNALNRDLNNGGGRITGIGMDDGGVFLYVDGNKHHIQLND